MGHKTPVSVTVPNANKCQFFEYLVLCKCDKCDTPKKTGYFEYLRLYPILIL